MKLAEALIARADAQKRLAQLRSRISSSAKHQEGDDPSEDPNALIREAEDVASDLNVLIQRINRTNARTSFDGTRTLTDALADRDVLLIRRKIYAEAAEAASPQRIASFVRSSAWSRCSRSHSFTTRWTRSRRPTASSIPGSKS